MSADTSILPSELLVNPQPLIGFSGLDIVKNSVHRSVWDSFNNNRKNDRAQIQFKLLPSNYEFPVSKPKRQSYEWYHPKGILKRNWMLKHLHVLPAVVVLFQDIEWNDSQWTEKQMHCASLVQSLKNALQGRTTKLAIVLLQKNVPSPPGDDLLAAERAANLTSKCDINAKMLFVLPHNDHLMGYTLRLESAFLELAQTYYTLMSKKVRMHRDQLTSGHQTLQIRHLFKLGFISEMKFDYATALSNYTNAYGNMDEIRIIDSNCLEMKTIAGFLNYKICKMMFRLNAPRDSITQFKSHIEKYRIRTGFKELLFEHYAWLSVQYGAFAELFCDAIKNGLPALQTQHPGIYYHKAAEYITKRKEAFFECSTSLAIDQINQTTNYSNVIYSDFFGVRGGKLSEPISEQQIIETVQQREKTFNHSAAIISLLGHAMAQFKIYKCLRFRKKLAIDMAEEYLKNGDHSKALTLYSLMLTDYRIDKWCKIFTEVLMKTLRSAYLAASVTDFITCSIEAMSPNIQIAQSERLAILENLWKVFQNMAPSPDNQITSELKSNWLLALNNFKSPLIIDLDKLSDLLECSISFVQPQVKHNEFVQLELFIRSRIEIPLRFQEFAIILSDTISNYKLIAKKYTKIKSNQLVNCENVQCNDDEANEMENIETNFLLEPNQTYLIHFNAKQHEFMENSELNIVRLQVCMGTDRIQSMLTQSSTLNQTKVFKAYNSRGVGDDDYAKNRKSYASCYIEPIFHLNAQNNFQNQPMLINEMFKVECIISNGFDISLQNVGISLTVPMNLRNKVYLATDLTKPRQKLTTQIQVDLGDLQMQSTTTIVYYLTSLIEGTFELQQKIWYNIGIQQLAESGVSEKTIEQNAIVESPTHYPGGGGVGGGVKSDKAINQLQNQHSINIETLADTKSISKSKNDTLTVSCVKEFHFNGAFYALNKQPLNPTTDQVYRNEDFLFRAKIMIKAPCNLDILDMFLIYDHNLQEKQFSKHGKKPGQFYANGDEIVDVKLLRAINLTAQWTNESEFTLATVQRAPILFHRKRSVEKSIDYHNMTLQTSQQNDKKNDKFKSNLLGKIPANSMIVDHHRDGMATNPLILNNNNNNKMEINLLRQMQSKTNKITENVLAGGGGGAATSMDLINTTTTTAASSASAAAATTSIIKSIYSKAQDAFLLTDHCRGFLRKSVSTNCLLARSNQLPDFGVYCIRWRRTGTMEENESKFIVNGIEIVEPRLNIYCYLDEKMYVKIPMTLTIRLINSTATTLRLRTCLKTSENFIFAGNTQLNISIYSNSSYDLTYNLYPLKAGWIDLPQFDVKYLNAQIGGIEKDQQIVDMQNYELQQLVNRWMPKQVFILPMLRNNNQ